MTLVKLYSGRRSSSDWPGTRRGKEKIYPGTWDFQVPGKKIPRPKAGGSFPGD